MSKWYEVTVQATKTIVVEIADDSERDPEEEAQEVACDEAFSFCHEVEVGNPSLLETPDEVEMAKRHADEVCAL